MDFYEDMGQIFSLMHKVGQSQQKLADHLSKQDNLAKALQLRALNVRLEPAMDELVTVHKFALDNFMSPDDENTCALLDVPTYQTLG